MLKDNLDIKFAQTLTVTLKTVRLVVYTPSKKQMLNK